MKLKFTERAVLSQFLRCDNVSYTYLDEVGGGGAVILWTVAPDESEGFTTLNFICVRDKYQLRKNSPRNSAVLSSYEIRRPVMR